jgi:hypothetical protein
MNIRRIALPVTLVLVVAGAAPAAAQSAGTPLAVVNDDTLTTVQLAREVGVMIARAPAGIPFDAPEPAVVLRRLIQNQMVIQEGYRMGLDQQFSVRNGVGDAVRSRCLRALLDSVALEVPAGDLERPALIEARKRKVADFLAELRATQNVTVDSTLLASLDYASADPEVKARLRDSDEVLAVLPNGTITVAGLSREIRFAAFHGLEGKPEAAARRDKIFWENLHERVVWIEARRLGLDKSPDVVAFAAAVERDLMLEESLGILVEFDFNPSEDEIRAYYDAHLDDVTPAARIRMESVKLQSEDEAAALREKALKGAKLSWLARNMPGVIDGPPPFPEDFFAPHQLGLDPAEVELGLVPEPYGVPGGWVVARIVEIEAVAPAPLEECRNQILRMMKSDDLRAHMTEVLDRLEAASEITVMPGAEAEVAAVTERAVSQRNAEIEAAGAAQP